MEILGSKEGIRWLTFRADAGLDTPNAPGGLLECRRQLNAYFQRKRTSFCLPILVQGTVFQKQVWRELQKIPYGQTTSYGRIAQSVGRPGGARAVGQANHRNPLPIVIPCHRVVGAGGKLVGYGSGLWRKEWLLRHEGALPDRV
jgi:methylated-DNA-[protein]-cysteine S-methyltransferase